MAHVKANDPREGIGGRHFARWCILPASLLALVPPTVAEAPLERAVKASYLFKFGPFVDWPANAFPGTDSTFQICITGQDPFGRVLDELVEGQRVHGRQITVRRIGSNDASGCQILFLGKQDRRSAAPSPDTGGMPILTVADRPDGYGSAMIEFLPQAGRVRFRINEASARASGLRISSKLLGLAVAVDRK